MSVLTEDLERSLFAHLADALPKELATKRPGERFSPERARGRWIEPRIVRIERQRQGRPQEPCGRVQLEIGCYVKSLQKGKRFLALSQLVDLLRLELDQTLGAPALRITDDAGQEVASLQFGPAQEERRYGVDVLVDGVAVKGLDVATVFVTGLLSGVC